MPYDKPFPIYRQERILSHYETLCTLIESSRHARKAGLSSSVRKGGKVNRSIKRLGREIFKAVLPRTTNQTLSGLVGEEIPLELSLDESSRMFPWELCFDGKDFLCTKHQVGRTTTVKAPKYWSEHKIGTGRALVVGLNYNDPLYRINPLEYCNTEARSVARRLEKMGFEVSLYVDDDAKFSKIISELKAGVDIFHFTGHASFSTRSAPDESGQLFVNDKSITAGELEACFDKVGAPFLSFVNACESGRERCPIDVWEPDRGMASVFLNYGAGVFVGTFWPIDDEPSKEVSVSFYENLKKGQSIGEAMRLTRLSCKQNRAQGFRETWPAYVLYGDPTRPVPESK